MIHGGAAHAHWWDHIAPLLAEGREVIASDLSGHGDSDRRSDYSVEAWAEEALAVAGIAHSDRAVGTLPAGRMPGGNLHRAA